MFDFFDWLADLVGDFFGDQTHHQAGETVAGAASGSTRPIPPALAQGYATIANDPVLSGIQQMMTESVEQYRDLMGSTQIPSSVDSTREMIESSSTASPEQLHRISTQLGATNLSDSISQSVSEHEQALRDSNSASLDRQAADQTLIQAQSVASGAETVLGKANSVLGTSS